MQWLKILGASVATSVLLAGCGTRPAETVAVLPSIPPNAVVNSVTNETKAQTLNATSLDMTSNSTGWAFTLNPGSPVQGDVLLRSNDRGQTWNSESPKIESGSTYVGGHVQDSNTVWVVFSATGTTSIWHTTNGAKSWSSTTLPRSYLLAHFSFIDASHGWLLASPGSAAGQEPFDLYETSDGGESWTQVLNAAEAKQLLVGQKTGIWFIDNHTGWITVDSGRHPGQVELYVTRDSGHSWSSQRVAVPSSLSRTYAHPEPPIFASSQYGVLPVLFSGKGTVFYTTHDGGKTWEPLSLVPIDSLVSVKTPDTHTIWGTDGKRVVVTGDSGKQWVTWQAPLSQDGSIVDVRATDSQTAEVYVLENGKVRRIQLIVAGNKIVQK